MKRFLITLCLLSLSLVAFQQTTHYNNSYQVEAYDEKGRPMTSDNKKSIDGSPFLNDGWSPGNVILEKQKMLRGVLLRFDLVNHILYFRKDSLALTFMEPVKEFSLVSKNEKGQDELVYFRTGFPRIGSRSENAFYQVIADGQKLQFIKFHSRRVANQYEYGRPDTKSYKDFEEYYFYEPESEKFIKVKLNERSLEKALPEYTDKIKIFSTKKDYNYRSEDEVAELVASLNL